jgi:hypothetical protein
MNPESCANCGATVVGPYCAQCGQETSIALPTAPAFLREAAGRYVAFDGRMWRTLGALFSRPGFLTREYLVGRRRRYVRPGRLFLVLWLMLFAAVRLTGHAPTILAAPDEARDRIASAARETPDADDQNITLDFGDLGKGESLLAPLRTRIDAYNHLPREQKAEQVYGGMLRYGPYAMVALLPLFAGMLKLVYLGRASRYPLRPRRYAAHLIYGAHAHAFVALVLLVMLLIPFSPVRTVLTLWILAYLPWSLKVVYGGRWSGIAARVLVVSFFYLICFAVAMAALVAAAVLLR